MRPLLSYLLYFCVFFGGCSSRNSIDELLTEYPQHRTQLRDLRESLNSLKKECGVNGFVSKYDGRRDLVARSSGDLISLPAATENCSGQQLRLSTLRQLAYDIGIDSVHLLDDELWVTVKGGGALGGDFGYLYSERADRAVTSDDFVSVGGDSYWYVFVRR